MMISNYDISKIIDLIYNHPDGILLDKVLLNVPVYERDALELQLLSLAKEGHLQIIKKDIGYVIKIITHPSLNRIDKASVDPDELSKIVVTMPTHLQKNEYRLGAGCIELRKAFEKMLSSSNKYVKLCVPFLEEPAVSFFSEHFRQLAERNINLKLLTRNVTTSQKTDYSNNSLLKGLLRIYDAYSFYGSVNNLEFRDHHISMIGDYKDIHYESIHAKIIIVDGKECYIGSGELRLNSMLYNFELGVLISEKPTGIVEQVFDKVWSMSLPIRYEYLTSKIRNNI